MALNSTDRSEEQVAVGRGSARESEPTGSEFADSRPELDAAVRELHAISDDAEFHERWSALDAEFPNEVLLAGARIRHLIKAKAFQEAIAEISAYDFGDDPSNLMIKAELLFDARDTDAAAKLYDLLIEQNPLRREIHLSYAKRLLSHGNLVRANALVQPFRGTLAEGTLGEALAVKCESLIALLSELEGEELREGRDERITAMKHAIAMFRDRELRPRRSAGLGKLTLITGSLGPGGAERQLTRLAIELEKARQEHGAVGGIVIDQPIDVVVRSHGPEKQNDFYLKDIEAAGITPLQINYVKPIAPKNLDIEDEKLLLLLDYMPSNVNFGVRRLTRYFQEAQTDTVSIWQDGACLFGGLAALIAGVRQIQLAIRGLPPSMRRHMYRPEYEVFYRSMAEVPGVTFVSNNVSAARAYAEWLDIPLDRFLIVYNGVEPMSTEPSSECEQAWDSFVARTADATHTIGGVFRFDTDKQPLQWIRFVARYLEKYPDSRILLVGAGRLLENAVELAEELGISERILFVGRSTCVGYWMTKMDALVLLSRYEGLPNVLIEAQYMGVHVVTTPAGGAAECLINGTTGHVLDCAEKPDLNLAVRLTHDLATRDDGEELFGEAGIGRRFLDSHFSIPHMLAQYVTCTSNGLGPFGYEEAEAGHSLRAA